MTEAAYRPSAGDRTAVLALRKLSKARENTVKAVRAAKTDYLEEPALCHAIDPVFRLANELHYAIENAKGQEAKELDA